MGILCAVIFFSFFFFFLPNLFETRWRASIQLYCMYYTGRISFFLRQVEGNNIQLYWISKLYFLRKVGGNYPVSCTSLYRYTECINKLYFLSQVEGDYPVVPYGRIGMLYFLRQVEGNHSVVQCASASRTPLFICRAEP